MSIFGWSYPPGAESDPYAPYNEDDDEEAPYTECQFCMAYQQRCPMCRRQDREQATIDRMEEERKK